MLFASIEYFLKNENINNDFFLIKIDKRVKCQIIVFFL